LREILKKTVMGMPFFKGALCGGGMSEQPQEVTRLLLAWNKGDENALEKLVPDC
jgi:hypothetical protein